MARIQLHLRGDGTGEVIVDGESLRSVRKVHVQAGVDQIPVVTVELLAKDGLEVEADGIVQELYVHPPHPIYDMSIPEIVNHVAIIEDVEKIEEWLAAEERLGEDKRPSVIATLRQRQAELCG